MDKKKTYLDAIHDECSSKKENIKKNFKYKSNVDYSSINTELDITVEISIYIFAIIIIITGLYTLVLAISLNANPVGGIITLFVGLFFAFSPNYIKKKHKKNAIERIKTEEAQREKEELNNILEKINKEYEKKVEEYDNKSKYIYELYLKNEYDINDKKTNDIIEKSNDIPEGFVEELYNNGKRLHENQKKENEKEEYNISFKEDIDKFNIEKELSNIINKDKYYNIINKYINGFDTMINAGEFLSDSFAIQSSAAKNVKQDDPYFWAGMSNGIAGPVAALMTANEINNRNEEKKLQGENISKRSREESIKWNSFAKRSKEILKQYKKIKNKIDVALIDFDSDLSNKISFHLNSLDFTKSNNIIISAKINTQKYKILNKNAFIDGSIQIIVYDTNNKEIAKGIYNAPNILDNDGNIVNPEKVGFIDGNVFNVVCIKNKNNKIILHDIDRIEFKPIHLWLIEDFNSDIKTINTDNIFDDFIK